MPPKKNNNQKVLGMKMMNKGHQEDSGQKIPDMGLDMDQNTMLMVGVGLAALWYFSR